MPLTQLRTLIHSVATTDPRIGPLSESLKWGQPSFAPSKPKVGTPIRIGETKDGDTALYTHCQTTVISDFRALFPDTFTYEGNRALILKTGQELPLDPLRLFILSALTYHLDK